MQEALLHQPAHCIEDVQFRLAAHGLGSLYCAAVLEHRQATKECLLLLSKEVVRPGDGLAHRPQSRRLVAAPARQQPERVAQAAQQRLGESTRRRAAASSIPNGNPSRR